MDNKIRINVTELNTLVKWLNALQEDIRQKVSSGEAILEITSTQTGVGESLNVSVLTFSKSMGWTKTNHRKHITDFDRW